MAASAAWADTPTYCLRLDEQSQIGTQSLSAREREAADFILKHAQHIAHHKGNAGEPILIRLGSNDPQGSHLVAYVPGKDGVHLSLVVHVLPAGQTHSLVSARNAFQQPIHEPQFEIGMTTFGFSYRFFDAGDYHIDVADTVTERDGSDGKSPGPHAFGQSVATGYSFGGHTPAGNRRDIA